MYSSLYLLHKCEPLRGRCATKTLPMGYAVYNTQKGKGSGGGLGNHIDRVPGMQHTYRSADENRTKYNKSFNVGKYSKMPLPEAISERIKEGYRGERKIRSDAVKYTTHIFSGTHEDMRRIFQDQNVRDSWIKDNYKFACDEFGQENILRFSLHLDEKTPHIHCVTVPLTKDGRLSCKEMMGGKKEMVARQDRYGELMEKYGLERGMSSDRKHQTKMEWEMEEMRNAYKTAQIDLSNVREKIHVNATYGIDELRKSLRELEISLQKSQEEDKKERKRWKFRR